MGKEKKAPPALLVLLKQIARAQPCTSWLDVLRAHGSPGNGQRTAQLGEKSERGCQRRN